MKLDRHRLECLEEWAAICEYAESLAKTYTEAALNAKTFAEKERMAGRVEILSGLKTWPRTLPNFLRTDDDALLKELQS